MALRLTWATGALLLVAQAASADISVTVTGVSDYDFRGISQSSGDPALQGSIDYSHGLFYASAWASQIDFDGTSEYGDGSTERVRVDGNVELDLVAGFAGELGNGLRWDAGWTWYTYPGSEADLNVVNDETDDAAKIEDYQEFYVGGGLGPVDVKAWYSPDLYDSGETAWYTEANASFGLPWELGLNLHAGYNFGDYFDLGDADYWDYAVGVARSFGHFDFEVKYVDNDLDSIYEVDDGPNRNDGRFILSVSTTFPWAGEGDGEGE